MALRNRCCTEEEAQHKHNFDWLLEATTKVTIYTSATQLHNPAKHGVEELRGKEKPRRNPSLNFLPPCVIYIHATNCDDQAGETWMELDGYYLSSSLPPPPPPCYLSPSILLLSFLLLPSSEKSGLCEAFGSEPLNSNQLPEQKCCTQVANPVSLPSFLCSTLFLSFTSPSALSSSLPPFLLSSLYALLPSSPRPLFP